MFYKRLGYIICILCLIPVLGCFACRGNKETEEPESKTFNVTFIQEGQTDIVIKVKRGETLTNIPTPADKKGYNVVWSVTSFENITSDLTVYAVENAKSYTIRYNLGSVSNDCYAKIDSYSQTVTYNQSYVLEIPECYGYKFKGWVISGTDTAVTDGFWLTDSDLTLTALWEYAAKSDRWWTEEF